MISIEYQHYYSINKPNQSINAHLNSEWDLQLQKHWPVRVNEIIKTNLKQMQWRNNCAASILWTHKTL